MSLVHLLDEVRRGSLSGCGWKAQHVYLTGWNLRVQRNSAPHRCDYLALRRFTDGGDARVVLGNGSIVVHAGKIPLFYG